MAVNDSPTYKSATHISLQELNSQVQDKSNPESLDNDDVKERTASTTIAEHLAVKLKEWRKILQVALLLVAMFSASSCFTLPIIFFPQKAKKTGLTELEIGIIFMTRMVRIVFLTLVRLMFMSEILSTVGNSSKS